MLDISTCAKCGGHMFKLVTQEPQGSRYKLNFVQCASCQAPIGVVDYFDHSTELTKLQKQLEGRLDRLEAGMQRIARALNSR